MFITNKLYTKNLPLPNPSIFSTFTPQNKTNTNNGTENTSGTQRKKISGDAGH